jgi:hypothetical protein
MWDSKKITIESTNNVTSASPSRRSRKRATPSSLLP